MTDQSRLPARVAMVCPSMPPELGGVETFVSRVSAELCAAQIPVSVFTQGTSAVEFRENGYLVNRSRSLTGRGALRLAPGTVGALRHAAADISVVHAHNFHSSAPLLAMAATTAPFVFTPHFHGVSATNVGRIVHNLVYSRLASRIFDHARLVTCVSHAESQALLRAYPDVADKLRVIPNGVDSHVFVVAEPMMLDRPTALVAGRLVKYKRVDLAIAATSLVPDLQLIVCGDGKELGNLRRLAREIGVDDRVRFLGKVSAGELRRWQRSVPVSLSLSRFEAFGLVAAEAAVAGSFVVASDVPAHRELRRYVEDEDRVCLVSEEVEEIASAIRAGLDASAAKPDQMGFYTWKQTADEFAALYREVLDGAGLHD